MSLTEQSLDARISALIEDAHAKEFSLALTRLVDGVSTYTLRIPGEPTTEHDGTDEAYEHLAQVRGRRRQEAIQALLQAVGRDTARLNYLETKVVNVRDPLVHGSTNLFWASPDTSYEGEEGPSDLRAQIDAAMQEPLP